MDLDLLERILSDRSLKPTDLNFSALQSITGNFSEEQIIGAGGFGTVYKGVLPNGQVAVKRIKNNYTIDEKLFRREVNSLWRVNHKNIVRFLGFCSHTSHKLFESEGSSDHIFAEDRERMLCFEYINNGSLENYITDELRGLQWDTRYSIIKGICDGLQYLHVEMGIIHRDLKPANILVDNNMEAKITDFGLARMAENAQTKSETGASTPRYTAPEYIDRREITVKYDVYSLGIIIIELVTGSRSNPDINNVLRRWRHRLHKLGKDTTYRCQQIAKLIEIGLCCQEKEPYMRPFIAGIISDIKALEDTNREISNAKESTVGQISPYLEDDMLGIEPLELRFPFKLDIQISCSVELTNETNSFIAFSVQTTSPLLYCIQPNKDIVAPRSKYNVNITLQPQNKAPQDKDTGNFILRSTKVKESLINEDMTENIFCREDGKLVDEVILTITYKGDVRKVDVSLGPPITSDMANLHGTQESNVPPTDAESETSASTSDEVIQFDPPELCFPLVPKQKVISTFKITNVTESYVSFFIRGSGETDSGKYSWSEIKSVLPPRSTECILVTREETEDTVKDSHFNRKYKSVYYAIVAADIKACDLSRGDYTEHKKLPIVLTKVNSCTSNELIQFDPPELSFPCQNKTSLSSVNIVNITDCYIGVNALFLTKNDAHYKTEPPRAILPPRSTQRVVVNRIPKEEEAEDMQCKDKFFVWNMIVAEGVQASNLERRMNPKERKELPLTFKKINTNSSEELIRLDHHGLRFTLLQNKIAMSSINMVNVSDYYIGFRFSGDTDAVHYQANPKSGILSPRSAQRVVVVARLMMEKEPEDTLYNDHKLSMWNSIVSEAFKVSDLDCNLCFTARPTNEFPIILNKVCSPSTSVELIKFDPPEVRFPFLLSKRLLSSFTIANNTEYHVGFNTRAEETNVALYITEPPCGILPPWSTQELVVTRVAKEEASELEDMQCKDKYYVWSCFATEDVNSSDIEEWMPITEWKELPIILTETSSNELIQFDPPELCLPLLPNQRVLSSSKMVNITDQYIGFRICPKKSNFARYNVNPSEGILPPWSMQLLLITMIADEKELEDSQCTDKFLVWNSIVTEDVKASDVIHNMPETKCTEFPIVVTEQKSSSISDELVQFDALELHFPFFPKKKVSTSIKIENLTDYLVGFNTYSRPTNVAWYHTEPPRGILPPRSTQKLMVTREEKDDALKDKQFNEKYFVWKSIVCEGVKDSYLSDCIDDQESKELPVILDKISSSVLDELIQLDPSELCIPLVPNKSIFFIVNVVNTTDFYVACNVYYMYRAAAPDNKSYGKGILPPRSTEKFTIGWETSEKELEDMEPSGDYCVWNRVVSERVDKGDIIGYMDEEESNKLPSIFNKARVLTSNELIRFDPPELSLPFMPNKPLAFSVDIVNNTDHCICFARYHPKTNVGVYYIKPEAGAMPPRSSQRLVVKRVLWKREQEDTPCQDNFLIWSCFVSEGAEANDIIKYANYEQSKEFPIVYKKTSLCPSDELIEFDPPHLPFPFLPNKRVSMLRKFKIVNVTDHIIGFSTWSHEDNSALYRMEPRAGILPPQSTQAIKVRRTLKENQTEDMECKDKIFVWNGIVTEDVQASDVEIYWKNGDKELPVVLTKPGERSSR